MKQIYSYRDYRDYLRDYYVLQKQSRSGFSYEKFSLLAGLKSPNYLKLVIDGKRDLSVLNIHQFALALGLSYDETQYFEALVLGQQSSMSQEAAYYENRILQLRKNRPIRSSTVHARELIARWYYPAVVIMLEGQRTENALELVSAKTGVQKTEIQEVINLLEENQILRSLDGTYHLSHDYFTFHSKSLKNSSQKQFLREHLELSRRAFEFLYEKGAKFYSHTFTIGNGRLDYFASRLTSLLGELTNESNNDPVEEVVQLNIQLFEIKGLKKGRLK